MSLQIREEVILLLMSVYGGVVLVLCYDVIRIFRRLFTVSVFRVIAEDIIFWTFSSIFMFQILMKYNYGIPRYFAVGTTIGSMALFEWAIGRHFVREVSKVLKKIMNTLLKPLKKIKKVIKLKYSKLVIRMKEKVKKCPNKEEPFQTNKAAPRREERLRANGVRHLREERLQANGVRNPRETPLQENKARPVREEQPPAD
jgi:hypothetical protein